MKNFLKDFWIEIVITITLLSLLLSEGIYKLTPGIQLLAKKILLVNIWYLMTYVFRVIRLGRIKWGDEDKKIYYFVLLLGSAIIIAFS